MKRFLKGLGIFLLLIGVGIVSALAVVALLLRQEEVRVPDLTGLQLKVDRREPHPTLPRDTVISQIPAPGSGIKKGRQVRIVISQGPADTQAPKLVGENFRKADIMIRQTGFVPGDVARVYSDTTERDLVIAQDPTAGSQLERGGRVGILVSAGKKAPVFVMPKLSGKKTDEAVRTIDRMGLQYRVISRPSSTRSQTGDRIVVSQKPAAGYPVASDATVDIVVNR
jgi:serine/threonine-protein kinase